MKPLLRFTAALAVVLGAAMPIASAGDTRASKAERAAEREAKRAAKLERKRLYKANRQQTTAGLRIEGEALEANLAKVETLAWHDDAASALEVAKAENKLVFLMNVLGDRCGHV